MTGFRWPKSETESVGLHDTRTSSQLGSGCCPVQTIPCLAEIKDFKTSAPKINLTSWEATTISATIPNPSGGLSDHLPTQDDVTLEIC